MHASLLKTGLAIAIFLAPVPLAAQVCNTQDYLVLSSQQDVDEFQANYGPCDALDFPLAISGEDIEDLDPSRAL